MLDLFDPCHFWAGCSSEASAAGRMDSGPVVVEEAGAFEETSLGWFGC